jgi:transcriptional regulator with XRE-family HTH domain
MSRPAALRRPTSLDGEGRELGKKIRSLRLQAKMTLQSLAQSVGVSESLISQVERGQVSPSITTLRRLAAELNIPLAALFLESTRASSIETKLDGRQIIVRRQERKKLRVARSRVNYELLTPDLSGKIEFLWIEYAPGTTAHSTSMAHRGEENAVCLKGSVVVTIEGRDFVLNEGDSISFDSGRAHQVENRTNEPAILVSAITPPSF